MLQKVLWKRYVPDFKLYKQLFKIKFQMCLLVFITRCCTIYLAKLTMSCLTMILKLKIT